MRSKFFPLRSIESFLERSYMLFFGTLFFLAIGAATFIFYNFSLQTSMPAQELITRKSDVFSESIILKINELLDMREAQFNQLRKLKPSITDPF